MKITYALAILTILTACSSRRQTMAESENIKVTTVDNLSLDAVAACQVATMKKVNRYIASYDEVELSLEQIKDIVESHNSKLLRCFKVQTKSDDMLATMIEKTK